MLIIGEKLSIIAKRVREAMNNRDKGPIQEIAVAQWKAGAGIIDANIGPAAKADILDAALGTLGTPPPVVDLSRSSADAPVEPGACTPAKESACVRLAGELASVNAQCVQHGALSEYCLRADALKSDIDAEACITCFVR